MYFVSEIAWSPGIFYQVSSWWLHFNCVLFVLSCVVLCMIVCVLQQVYEHAVCDDTSLKKLIKRLLAIISRPARLLEVLVREFTLEYVASILKTCCYNWASLNVVCAVNSMCNVEFWTSHRPVGAIKLNTVCLFYFRNFYMFTQTIIRTCTYVSIYDMFLFMNRFVCFVLVGLQCWSLLPVNRWYRTRTC